MINRLFLRWPLWLYSLANLANSLSYTTFNSYAIFFYSDVLQAPARLIGQAWFAYGVWNTINDLIIGWFSDRVPSRLGRRVFLMLVFALPVGLAYFLFWSPPAVITEAGPAVIVAYFLILAGLYDLSQTAVNISQGAVFPELAISADARVKLSAFRQILGIGGLALAFVLSPIIYTKLGWPALGLIWGLAITLLYLLSAVGIRFQTQGQSITDKNTKIRSNLRSLFQSRSFLLLMGLNFFVRFGIASLQIAMPFYASYVLGLSPAVLAFALGGILASAALTVPIWSPLIRRFGPRSVGLFILSMNLLLLAPLLFTTNLWIIVPLALLIGPAYSGLTIILELLYAQVVDHDSLKVGQSRAGLIGGILGTTLRFSPAVAGLIIGELLSLSSYNPILSVQPSDTRLILRLAMTLVPAVSLGVGCLLLYFYPLHGRRLQEIQLAKAKLFGHSA